MIVIHFFIYWPLLAKFLEAICCVSRRVTFVEDVLKGSAGKIMREMAQAFNVHGEPYHYPIYMEGKTVLKLDLTPPPGLTPEQKKLNQTKLSSTTNNERSPTRWIPSHTLI